MYYGETRPIRQLFTKYIQRQYTILQVQTAMQVTYHVHVTLIDCLETKQLDHWC